MKTNELKALNIRLFAVMTELETNWDGLATRLGVTRTFITSARKGTRNLGTEPLRKLKELEKETGLVLNRNFETKEETNNYTSERENPPTSHDILREQLNQSLEREKALMEIIKNLTNNGVKQ